MELVLFDVEAAKLALAAGTGEIITREGNPVEIICWDTKIKGDDWPVEGKIHSSSDSGKLRSWTREGGYSFFPDQKHKYDLFIKTNLDL